VLPDEVMVADDGVALRALEGVVLGLVTNDGPEADEVVLADGGMGTDIGVGQDAGAGPDAAGAVDDDPGTHRNVGGQFHVGRDVGAGVNGHRGSSPGSVPADIDISRNCSGCPGWPGTFPESLPKTRPSGNRASRRLKTDASTAPPGGGGGRGRPSPGRPAGRSVPGAPRIPGDRYRNSDPGGCARSPGTRPFPPLRGPPAPESGPGPGGTAAGCSRDTSPGA